MGKWYGVDDGSMLDWALLSSYILLAVVDVSVVIIFVPVTVLMLQILSGGSDKRSTDSI